MYDSSETWLMILSGTIALAIFAVYAVWDFTKHRDLFSPGIIVPASFWIFFYPSAYIVTLVPGDYRLAVLADWQQLPDAVVYNTLGMIGLVAGLRAFRGPGLAAGIMPDFTLGKELAPRIFLLLSFLACLACMSLYYFKYSAALESPEKLSEGQAALVLARLGPIALVYCLETAMFLKKRLVFCVAAGYAMFWGMLLASVGSRRTLLTLVILGLIWIYYGWGFGDRFLLARVRFSQATRSMRSQLVWAIGVGTIVLVSVLAATFVKTVVVPERYSSAYGAGEIGDTLIELILALNYNKPLTNEIAFYCGKEYQYGATLLNSLASAFVPQTVLGLDLLPNAQEEFQSRMETEYAAGGTLSVGVDYSLPAEGYINFGPTGVFVVMFIVGAIFSIYYAKYILSGSLLPSSYTMIAPYVAIITSLDIMRKGFNSFMKISVSMLIAMWLLFLVARFLSPRKKSFRG